MSTFMCPSKNNAFIVIGKIISTIYCLVFLRDCLSVCYNALFMSAYDITNLLNAMFDSRLSKSRENREMASSKALR